MRRNLDRYGHVVHGSTRALVVDLTPDLQVGTEVSAELVQFGAEIWSESASFSVRWTLTAGASSNFVVLEPDDPFRFSVPAASSVDLRAELLNRGATTSIDLSQILACNNVSTHRMAWERGSNSDKAVAELAGDLFDYIEHAARATGSNGVSARFVAAVLFIEIYNRPKSGRAAELDEVREETIELVFERHRRDLLDWINANLYLHRSVGVGQTRMSTLAMALGWMGLIEHERVSGHSSRENDIEEAFMRLTTDQMWELWRRLRWPKSAVNSVARILASLKNRPNRYPLLSKSQFGTNHRAMAIIATEYNMGATNSPEGAAGSTWYGDVVASNCALATSSNPYSVAVPTLTLFSH